MQPEQFSKTALGVARRRAVHQLFDRPLVLEDSLALRILDAASQAEVRATPPERLNHPFHQAMRFLMALRSRFAEDSLAEAVLRGVSQYVVLGAGLDASAYRCPFPEISIFEVDYPATQVWKRHRVADARLSIPPRLTYAPVDCEQQTLAEGLDRAGFGATQPAFFSWLGVVPYLTREAVLTTLQFIGSLPAGSAVVFDYPIPEHLLDLPEQMARAALAERVAAAGEPFRLSFDPLELARELRTCGFTQLNDLDPAAINARFLQDRAPHVRVGIKGLGVRTSQLKKPRQGRGLLRLFHPVPVRHFGQAGQFVSQF